MSVSFHNTGHNIGRVFSALVLSAVLGSSVAGCAQNVPRDDYVVFFDYESVTLSPTGEAIVQKAAKSVQKRGIAVVTVSGSAESQGEADVLKALATERAKAVADLLKADGVPEKAITITPYTPSTKEDSRVALRRVIIHLGPLQESTTH